MHIYMTGRSVWGKVVHMKFDEFAPDFFYFFLKQADCFFLLWKRLFAHSVTTQKKEGGSPEFMNQRCTTSLLKLVNFVIRVIENVFLFKIKYFFFRFLQTSAIGVFPMRPMIMNNA